MRPFKNLKKLIGQITIKRMLAGLVCLGGIVVASLSIISLMSINTMADSQKRLSVISRDWKPAVQEIKTALETFIRRQGHIASVKTIKELSPFQERKSLELKYEERRDNLEKLIPIVTGADQKLRRLTSIPALASFSTVSVLLLTGPIVAIIFAFFTIKFLVVFYVDLHQY